MRIIVGRLGNTEYVELDPVVTSSDSSGGFKNTTLGCAPESFVADQEFGDGRQDHESNARPQEERLGCLALVAEAKRCNKVAVANRHGTNDTVDEDGRNEERQDGVGRSHQAGAEERPVKAEVPSPVQIGADHVVIVGAVADPEQNVNYSK